MIQYSKTSITVLFFIGLVIIVHSCKKDELPILSTSTLSNITATSAFSGGNITSDGRASVIEKGVCWSLNEDPTISDSRTVDGNGIGQFTSSITGLVAGSTYHTRAYATNSIGTAYGSDLSFSTLGKAPECITLPASNTTSSGTTLNGTVNANYLSTTVSFEYGTTISYGQTVIPEQNQLTGNSFTNVLADINGLTPGTIYHFRLKTMNSLGVTFGNDLTFSTADIPMYVSSSIQNATPNILEMTYNLNLANITPASDAFSVKVNSVVKAVNSVSISSTKVLLILVNPVLNGDIVTISYTKPASNPLQTSSGGQATTINDQSVINNVIIPSQPIYVNSAIENATPATLEMTYNTTLANVAPAASAFLVRVNSVARVVNTIVISGTKVRLSLASPILYGDVVTVAYSKPSSNPIQTVAGGQATNLSAQTVTNRVSSTPVVPGVNPVYVGSTVENETPYKIALVYNITLSTILPAVSAFSVNINSVSRPVSSLAISGSSVILTLGSAVIFGDVVTVSYTKPSTNALQSTSGLQVATMSAQTVSNKVSSVGPIYVSSSVENSTPNILVITYNEILGNSIPPASAFIVMVNGINRTITSVAISGNKVLLTLAESIVSGDIITFSYIKPASNPLQKVAGGQAVNISNLRVTNNVIR